MGDWPPVVPQSASAGLVFVSDANGGGSWLADAPMVGCSLRATDGTNPVAGTYSWTEVSLSVEYLDSNATHPVSGNNSRWQVPVAGWYQINVMGVWDSNSTTGQRGVKVYNTTTAADLIAVESPADANTIWTRQGASALIQLAANDVLAFMAENLNSGAIVSHKALGKSASGFDCFLVGT